MSKTLLSSILLVLAISMTGCATERVIKTGNEAYPAKLVDNVKLYSSETPKKHYKEIGRVSVDKYNNFAISRSGEEINRLLKEQAASIGGDAVINITEDFASVSGTVIAYK